MKRKDIKRRKKGNFYIKKLLQVIKFALKPKMSIIIALLVTVILFYISGYYGKSALFIGDKYKKFSTDSNLILKDVILDGNKNTSKQEILDILAIPYSSNEKSVIKGTPILSIDLKEIQKKLIQMEWIESATVERLLPSTLNIRVVERTPFALWQSNRKVSLIDSNGEIINVNNLEKFVDLIILIGDQAQSYAGLIFNVINKEPDLARRVSSLTFVSNRRWNVNMFNGLEVKLPEKNVDKAWAELAIMQASSSILDRGAKMLDMRLEDRLYVK